MTMIYEIDSRRFFVCVEKLVSDDVFKLHGTLPTFTGCFAKNTGLACSLAGNGVVQIEGDDELVIAAVMKYL